MVADWNKVEDTPAWARELLEAMGDDAVTVNIAHRQAEVQLTIRILTEQPPDVWEEWAQSEHTPMWMRSAIVEYSVADSRWQHVRQVAELELLEELLGRMLEQSEDDVALPGRQAVDGR